MAPLQWTLNLSALRHALLGAAAGLAVAAGASPAVAQSEKPASELPPVSVEATGTAETAYSVVHGYVAGRSATGTKTDTPLIETPQSMSVVTRDRLDGQGVNYLNEALRYIPGVQGETFGLEPRLTYLQIRGFEVYTQGIYRDGLRLANPGFLVSYNLEPYGADRIEILRGPASVLYGQGSPGGLVNFVSKRPSTAAARELAFETGSYNRLQGMFDLGDTFDPAGVYSFRLTGLVRDSDTQIDFVRDQRQYVAPALAWRPDPNTTLVFLSHFHHDRTRDSQAVPGAGTLTGNPNGSVPSNRFTGEPAVDRYERTEYAVGYAFQHRADDTWTFRQNFRHYGTRVHEAVVYATGLLADQRTLTRAFFDGTGQLRAAAVDTQAQANFATGPVAHTALAGVDFQRVDAGTIRSSAAAPSLDVFAPVYGAPVAASAPYQDDETTADQVGLYLQDQIKLDKHWILAVGGRYDWADSSTLSHLTGTRTAQSDSDFTGRAGLLYLSDIGLAPYASYAQSFLPVIGNDPVGKPFKPETGEQVEVGVKFQPAASNSFVTAALFELRRQNMTQFNPATFLTVQTGEVRSRGAELEAVTSLDLGLSLTGSFTYLDAAITRSVIPVEIGARPKWVPEFMASLWGDYTQRGGPLDGWGFGLGIRYQGDTFGDTPNTIRIPGTTLVDAAIHYNWDRLRLSVVAHNLFDNEYVASCYRRSSVLCTFGERRGVIGRVAYRW